MAQILDHLESCPVSSLHVTYTVRRRGDRWRSVARFLTGIKATFASEPFDATWTLEPALKIPPLWHMAVASADEQIISGEHWRRGRLGPAQVHPTQDSGDVPEKGAEGGRLRGVIEPHGHR